MRLNKPSFKVDLYTTNVYAELILKTGQIMQ